MLKEETKTAMIRRESARTWEYLKYAIECLEKKIYQQERHLDELLAYCKSCEESYEEIVQATYDIEDEMASCEECRNSFRGGCFFLVEEAVAANKSETDYEDF